MIDKISYSFNIPKAVSFKGNEPALNNTSSTDDKAKSYSMAKMVGLGALAAATIGGLIYAVKSGNTSKVTQNNKNNEIPELIKKIFRKDGSLLKTVEKDKDGKLLSEKVFAKDGKTLKMEVKYDDGQKVGLNVFDSGKPKFSYVFTPEYNGYMKMEYDYKTKSLISKNFENKQLQTQVFADIETGAPYRTMSYDDGLPLMETFSRRKDGEIYETVSYQYSHKPADVLQTWKFVKKFNPNTGSIVKKLYYLENDLAMVESYKKGKLYKIIESYDGKELFYDLNNGKISRVVYYNSNGEIKRIKNFNTKNKEPEILSEIVYAEGKPQTAVTYTKGGAASRLTYDKNGAKQYKEYMYPDGELQRRTTYGSLGKKVNETSFYPDGETTQSLTLFYPNGKKQEVKTYYENNKLEFHEFYLEKYTNPYKIIKNNENGQMIFEQEKNPRSGFLSREVEYYENINSAKPVKKAEVLYDSATGRETLSTQYNEKGQPVKFYDFINDRTQKYVYNEDGTYFKINHDGKSEKFDVNGNSLGEYLYSHKEFIRIYRE